MAVSGRDGRGYLPACLARYNKRIFRPLHAAALVALVASWWCHR
jgi:hypothetical protein